MASWTVFPALRALPLARPVPTICCGTAVVGSVFAAVSVSLTLPRPRGCAEPSHLLCKAFLEPGACGTTFGWPPARCCTILLLCSAIGVALTRLVVKPLYSFNLIAVSSSLSSSVCFGEVFFHGRRRPGFALPGPSVGARSGGDIYDSPFKSIAHKSLVEWVVRCLCRRKNGAGADAGRAPQSSGSGGR